jgi:hypothetical protein
MLGGDIVLEDNKGGGCVFTLWLQSKAAQREKRASGQARVTA